MTSSLLAEALSIFTGLLELMLGTVFKLVTSDLRKNIKKIRDGCAKMDTNSLANATRKEKETYGGKIPDDSCTVRILLLETSLLQSLLTVS